MFMSGPLSVLADDAKAALLQIVNNAAGSIQKNPTPTNVAAQGAVAVASLIPLLPTLESDAIVQFTQFVQEAAQKALAPTPSPSAHA